MKVRISRGNSTLIELSHHNRREYQYCCPHCDKDYGDFVKPWLTQKCMKEIVLNGPACHSNGGIIVSECPNCFELSWIHQQHIDIRYHLKEDSEEFKANEEELRLKKKKCVEDWNKSLCKRCRFMKEMSDNCMYPYVSCNSSGWSRSGEAEIKCNRFEAKKSKSMEAKKENGINRKKTGTTTKTAHTRNECDDE